MKKTKIRGAFLPYIIWKDTVADLDHISILQDLEKQGIF